MSVAASTAAAPFKFPGISEVPFWLLTLIFAVLALIFEIVSVTRYPDDPNDAKNVKENMVRLEDVQRFHNLALFLSLAAIVTALHAKATNVVSVIPGVSKSVYIGLGVVLLLAALGFQIASAFKYPKVIMTPGTLAAFDKDAKKEMQDVERFNSLSHVLGLLSLTVALYAASL